MLRVIHTLEGGVFVYDIYVKCDYERERFRLKFEGVPVIMRK
jgi:hypothetical protein